MIAIVTLSARFETTPDNRLWTSIPTHGHDFWTRYLDVFDQVVLVARAKRVNRPADNSVEATGDSVIHHPYPYYEGPERFAKTLPRGLSAARKSLVLPGALFYRVPDILAGIFWLLQKWGRPYAVEVVGDPYLSMSPACIDHPLIRVFRALSTQLLKRQCAGACAAAYVTSAALQRRYPPVSANFHTHYSSIRLKPEAYVQRPKEFAPVAGRPARIVSVGGMNTLYKAPDNLLCAVARLGKMGVPVKATLVGGGRRLEDMSGLARRLGIANRVRFLGHAARWEQIRAQLDAADLFVLPSRQEGLPRAMIEAMSRALPCIGSTVGGIPELLPPEDTVPPNAPEILAQRIAEVVRDPERMRAMSARNLEKSREHREDVLRARRVAFYTHVKEETEKWQRARKK